MDQDGAAGWATAVSALKALVKPEDCWDLGDQLFKIQTEWGRKKALKVALEAGHGRSKARQRIWMSETFPAGDPIREMKLTYSHLRELPATADPLKWATLASENDWPVAKLKEEIEKEALGATLSAEERENLAQCEAVVQRGLQTFLDVGQALLSIRDGRLYRGTHDTFETYCRERWGMARQRAYQLIDAAQVVRNVSTVVDIVPANERQARPLTRLPDPAQQREVWREVVAEGQPITTARVEQKVRDAKRQRQQPAPVAPPVREEAPNVGRLLVNGTTTEDVCVDIGQPDRQPSLQICLTTGLAVAARDLAAFYLPHEWTELNDRVRHEYARSSPNPSNMS